MVAWIHQQADSHMLGAFVQMWCHPSKNMKITSQKQPKSIKHRRKGDCWSVLPAVPSLHSFPNWTRSSGRCGESPLPLTRPGVPLKKGPKIPISTAAHLIHDLSGLGKCPFLGLYFTLEKPMKGGSHLRHKFLWSAQDFFQSTNINRYPFQYQQISTDKSGYLWIFFHITWQFQLISASRQGGLGVTSEALRAGVPVITSGILCPGPIFFFGHGISSKGPRKA